MIGSLIPQMAAHSMAFVLDILGESGESDGFINLFCRGMTVPI
jgi:hypothetical protein